MGKDIIKLFISSSGMIGNKRFNYNCFKKFMALVKKEKPSILIVESEELITK